MIVMSKAMNYLAEAVASRLEREFSPLASHEELVSFAEPAILGIAGWLDVLDDCRERQGQGGVTRDDIVGFLNAFGIGDNDVAVGAMCCLLPVFEHESEAE